jgi:hypothetical protein
MSHARYLCAMPVKGVLMFMVARAMTIGFFKADK